MGRGLLSGTDITSHNICYVNQKMISFGQGSDYFETILKSVKNTVCYLLLFFLCIDRSSGFESILEIE